MVPCLGSSPNAEPFWAGAWDNGKSKTVALVRLSPLGLERGTRLVLLLPNGLGDK